LPNSLSADQVRQLARRGAEVRLQELQSEIAGLQGLLGTDSAGSPRGRRRRATAKRRRARRGQLSAEGRAAIAAAQKARWAKIKLAKRDASAPNAIADTAATRSPRKRRQMSPQARKAAAERMRKYWAERRKARAKK
jgi:hypothetical protein